MRRYNLGVSGADPTLIRSGLTQRQLNQQDASQRYLRYFKGSTPSYRKGRKYFGGIGAVGGAGGAAAGGSIGSMAGGSAGGSAGGMGGGGMGNFMQMFQGQGQGGQGGQGMQGMQGMGNAGDQITELVADNTAMNTISKASSHIGDIAALWSATQNDNKAAKVAQTFKNTAAATGVVGNELKKDIKGGGKFVEGYFSKDPNKMMEGIQMAADEGTELSEVRGGSSVSAEVRPAGKAKKGVNAKFSYLRRGNKGPFR